jgi:hypothetical protein
VLPSSLILGINRGLILLFIIILVCLNLPIIT